MNASVKTSSESSPHRWHRFSLVLFILITLTGVFTVSDYGLTWDEEFRFQGGDSKLEYYQQLLSGEDPAQQKSSYPGLFDLPLALAHQAFPDWGTRSEKGHLWSLCFGLLGLFRPGA